MHVDGQTIEKIRQEKNITLDELTHGIMDKSSYTRFRAGKMTPSAEKFIALLNRLKILYPEYKLVRDQFDVQLTDRYNVIIQEALCTKETDALHQLVGELSDLLSPTEAQQDFYRVAQLVEQHLTNQPLSSDLVSHIKHQLCDTYTWYHHELTLFRHTLFLFETHELMHYAKLAVKSLDSYEQLNKYGSESIRLLLQLVGIMIIRRELAHAHALFRVLQSKNLKQDYLVEKLTLTFLGTLLEYADNNPQLNQELKNQINHLKTLNDSYLVPYWEYLFNHTTTT